MDRRSAPLPLLVVRLRGTQAQMGEQHGRCLRQFGGYEQTVEYYPELPARLLFGGLSGVAGKLAQALSGSAADLALRWMERYRPKPYLERTRAFAEALGLPRSFSRHLMVMDVFQNFVGVIGRLGLGPFAGRAAPACSSLAVWGAATSAERLYHARNFDFPGIGVWDQAPTVVFCDPQEGIPYGFVTTRGADIPGITAFNAAGLTVTTHTRFHRDVSFCATALTDLVHDIVRRAESLQDACRIAEETKVASTWGIALSSGRERSAVVLETTAAGTSIVRPQSGACHLACTNRYHDPEKRKGEVTTSSSWTEHCDGREARFNQAVTEARRSGGLEAADLERLLGDHLDPDAPGRVRGGGSILSQPETVKSVVCDPDAEEIRVSAGPAPTGWGPFEIVPWSWAGPVEGVEWQPGGAGGEARADDLRSRRQVPFESRAEAEGYSHFQEAVRLDHHPGNHDHMILAHLEQAVALVPREPTYRFLAGMVLLKEGEADIALDYFTHGLLNEQAPFRRGQLLLWGSRAAHLGGAASRAADMRRELLNLSHPHLAEYQEAATAEERTPFPRWRLRFLQVALGLVDAIV
ncbi:C45 family autoproteolytic acyltransferase/hydrolase [Planctomycetota bacterium]